MMWTTPQSCASHGAGRQCRLIAISTVFSLVVTNLPYFNNWVDPLVLWFKKNTIKVQLSLWNLDVEKIKTTTYVNELRSLQMIQA